MEAPIQSQTLYLNNLNEKISKPVLKKMLYMLFSQYGKVVEIQASKGLKLRGQAWVVFENVGAATNALRGKQGFMFYDKPMKIAFANHKSKIVAQREALTVSQTRSVTGKRGREDSNSLDNAAKRSTGQASKILFAQNLPSSLATENLIQIFKDIPGFVEVRVPPGDMHRGSAFIEFANDVSATLAMKQLDGFQISATDRLSLSYSL